VYLASAFETLREALVPSHRSRAQPLPGRVYLPLKQDISLWVVVLWTGGRARPSESRADELNYLTFPQNIVQVKKA
jgi:hypothetical protein